jgi:Xaa-Pro aminopeptidase
MNSLLNLQKLMPKNLDGAVIFSEHNRRYFTGFNSSDGILFVTREVAVFLVDFRYIEAAKSSTPGCEVVLLTDKSKQLLGLFNKYSVLSCGIEAFELRVATLSRLKKDLPQVKFDETCEFNIIIENLRRIKSNEELENIKHAQLITDAAFEHIIKFIKIGMTEKQVALELEYFIKCNGASRGSFDFIVVSAENSSLPHGVPTERKLQNGDMITMDFGAVYNGYCSDMTRTVAIGSVTEQQRQVYNTVLHAQITAEKAIKSGMKCNEIDKIARDIIDNAGFKGCFGHGLGHSLGLLIHEEPRFSPSCNTILEKNMVLTVEPGIYLEKQFGVRIEDMVIITENGCENLTKSIKELIII